MATLLLAAAGQAIGASIGGSILGVGATVLGKTAGAVIGGLIDQKIMGSGSEVVERGKASSLRLQHSQEGRPIPRVYGRMRVGGQVIWATRFKEHVTTTGSGKGGGPKVRQYSYTISIAIALCEGKVDRLGRIWADGKPFSLENVSHRFHDGSEDQLPDPLIAAVEGDDNAPAYRGVAYLVLEDLPLDQFGARVPQINAEVYRQPQPPEGVVEAAPKLTEIVRGVAMSPGTGEFVYETDVITKVEDEGVAATVNANSVSGEADVVVALDQLQADLPSCGAVSLVVSWFGTDLRCAQCEIHPGVEFTDGSFSPRDWSVAGRTRTTAYQVTQQDGRPIYGGTPTDTSVIALIEEMKARGLRVMFYPFLLMDIPEGNSLPAPDGSAQQPAFPWRGRIASANDGQAGAGADVDAFFGTAAASDFAVNGKSVAYSGPDEWRYRRFILHCAALCQAAGGVEAFCVGSEFRGLTRTRAGAGDYPAVAAMRALTTDVRALLPDAKLGYAADWSEYFGHQVDGGFYFHLDPLWADAEIDFIGIDYYMPLTDWRDGPGHLDGEIASSIYDLEYLASRFGAGENHDWYYADNAARVAQDRTPIADLGYGEHWIYRPKDIAGWWSNPHHNRPGGVRAATATEWVPGSKPVWLTEIGVAAVDKGTNQPNVFFDPKSSESGLPHFSTGAKDDYIQQRMLQAAEAYWSAPANNPVSAVYGGPMMDLSNTYVWTWDARPWPDFPQRAEVWSDGANHARGHWLTGRTGAATLADTVAEICAAGGLTDIDVSGLTGLVTGFLQDQTQSPRAALQDLMLAFGFDAYEDLGVVRFVMRGAEATRTIAPEAIVFDDDPAGSLRLTRGAGREALSEVRLGYLQSNREYEASAVETRSPDAGAEGVEGADVAVALTAASARVIAERWARETSAARDRATFLLPPSDAGLQPGDVVALSGQTAGDYRIDRIRDGLAREVEATRIDTALYRMGDDGGEEPPLPGGDGAVTPGVRFLDIPAILNGADPHQPYIAAWSDPFPGTLAVYTSDQDDNYSLLTTLGQSAVAGRLLSDLPAGRPWLFDRGPGAHVRLFTGSLESREDLSVLNGANLAAIELANGEWELMQFQTADLIGPREYRLTRLLRGQGGTEHLIGDPVPAGQTVVFLTNAVVPLNLPESMRGLERHYRVGPADRDLGDPTFVHQTFTFTGRGERPFAPVDLTAARTGGDISVSWIRRGRLDQGVWLLPEIPLFETQERYQVEVLLNGASVRISQTSSPAFTYTAAEQAADGVTTTATFRISQISDLFGPGASAEVTFSD